jgi:RNA polymerase sigma factor (sigma-70 family)
MNDDAELLRRYVEEGANGAFSELVQRHVDLVYSAALRRLNGDAHLAADATQLVFTDLARKAETLVGHRVLAGWLFTSTRYATSRLVRGERRRHAREVEAHLMQEINHDADAAQLDWQQVRPVLDDVIGELTETDREAILLRFFEGRDYAGVGARLGLADNTARMRIERALDRLRGLLQRRGVTSTSTALAIALANQAVVSAPAGLASAVAGTALAGGVTVGGIATAGTAGAGGITAVVNFMSMTKLQLGLSSALAVAGGTGFVMQANTNEKLRDEAARLRAENTAITRLESENVRLGRLAVEVEEMRRDDTEFLRLQEKAGVLKERLQELARAEEARQLRQNRSGQAFEISSLDQVPVGRFMARPQYPFEMRQAGIDGNVVVDFVVDAGGNVQNAYAIRSSRQEFDAAAVEAVSRWKFQPGVKGGRNVLTHMQVPIVFTLNGRSGASVPPGTGSRNPAATNPDAAGPVNTNDASSSGSGSTVMLDRFHVVFTEPDKAPSSGRISTSTSTEPSEPQQASPRR